MVSVSPTWPGVRKSTGRSGLKVPARSPRQAAAALQCRPMTCPECGGAASALLRCEQCGLDCLTRETARPLPNPIHAPDARPLALGDLGAYQLAALEFPPARMTVVRPIVSSRRIVILLVSLLLLPFLWNALVRFIHGLAGSRP